MIELQNCDSHAPLRGQGIDQRALEPEVLSPDVLAGVEERSQLPCVWVQGTQVSPFEPIAVRTRQGEVVCDGSSAVFLGDDVLYLPFSA
jgi:hypothetical protein